MAPQTGLAPSGNILKSVDVHLNSRICLAIQIKSQALCKIMMFLVQASEANGIDETIKDVAFKNLNSS